MTKTAKDVQDELRNYLSSKTDKDLNLSDNRIIAAEARGRRLKEDGTMKKAAAKRRDNPQWQKSREETFAKRSENTTWLERKTLASRQLAQDPTWLANQKVGAEKRKARPDWKEKRQQAVAKRESNEQMRLERAERNRKQVNDPNYLANLHAGIQSRNQDPEYQKSLMLGARAKLIKKGFIVSPVGVHLRQNESAEANGMSVTKLQRLLKNDSKNYYYISHEEYIILFGKEYDGD